MITLGSGPILQGALDALTTDDGIPSGAPQDGRSGPADRRRRVVPLRRHSGGRSSQGLAPSPPSERHPEKAGNRHHGGVVFRFQRPRGADSHALRHAKAHVRVNRGDAMAAKLYPMWAPGVVEAVCKVLASTDWPGLSGSEIGRLLAMRGFDDIAPGATKWERLEVALQTQQQKDRASNCLIRFITDAMEPSRHVSDPGRFSALRDSLTEALALVGLRITEQGKVGTAERAATLDEVARLAGRLRTELTRRGVHKEVLAYCNEELIRQSLFHAVFEAVKGLGARLRLMTGAGLDGSDLIDYCFGGRSGQPVVRINAYASETDQSEHRGFANLMRGIFGTFRNPPAHAARAAAEWTITEADALDLFSMLSFIHRRLDHAAFQPRASDRRPLWSARAHGLVWCLQHSFRRRHHHPPRRSQRSPGDPDRRRRRRNRHGHLRRSIRLPLNPPTPARPKRLPPERARST